MKLSDILKKLKPVSMYYKAEAGAVGATIAMSVGTLLGWQPMVIQVVGVVAGYTLAYLRSPDGEKYPRKIRDGK